MPVYIRKHPLEIPPPSERDWIKEEEEGFFPQDPDRALAALPQPARMISKLVMLVFENAMEIVERREALQEAQKGKVQATKCSPTAEFQVTGRASCLAASGKYIFVGLSMGLAVFQVSDCKQICAWDTAKTEICVIRASALGDEHHVLLAVDELGFVWLFCFHKDSFLFIKNLNEVEDISKRSTCMEVVLSQGGDYAGVLLQGSTEAWLDIYRLPKDSWLKERENSPGAAAGLAFRDRKSSQGSTESLLSISKTDAKLGLPVLLLKVKPPKPITGSNFKSPLDALMKVDDGSVFGLGHNHLIKDSQWEQREAIFRNTYQEYLEAESESKDEISRHATLHFLLPSRILQVGPEIKLQPAVPAGISVHWDGSHNLCLYLLNRPFKEKVDADPKPEVVWPCAAPIACSAVSSCCRYLALACEDAAITIWDQHLGYPLSVTALPDEHAIRSMHFLRSAATAGDLTRHQAPYPGPDPAHPVVQLLVLCTDGSLYLVKAPRAGKSSITVLADRPEDPKLAISTVAPILAFPSTALVFSWDGIVSLMDTATSRTICYFNIPPSYAVASPWQPVFTMDPEDQWLILQGDKQQAGVVAQSTASHSSIFIFDFNSYLLQESFPRELDLPDKPLQDLPWIERCNIFFRDWQQSLQGLGEQMPEYWSRLQARAAAMDRKREREKERKSEGTVEAVASLASQG